MKRHPETRQRAKDLRTNLTEPERKLWNLLRANRLNVKFQRQVVIAPYIADFAARSHRLIVELDGDSHATAQSYDEARTRHMENLGYRVLRFSNAEVMTNVEGVVTVILSALGSNVTSPSPRPSPPEGGEGAASRTA